MKIMMVSAYVPGYHNIWGGAEMETKRIWDLVKSMGHEVFMFCLDVETGKKIPPGMFTTKTMKETPYAKIPLLYSQFYQFGILDDFVAADNFANVLDEVKPDVVHFHNFLPMSMSLVKETYKREIPSVLTVYDYKYICMKETLFKDREGVQCETYGKEGCMECLGISMPALRTPLLKRRQELFKVAMGKIDRITCLSENSRQVMIKGGYNGEKIVVIRASIDISPTGEEEKIEKGLVLFVGWIQVRKGIHIVTKAFEKVVKEIPEAKLVVFGEGEEAYKKKIKDEVEKAGISGNVDFRGKRPHEEVKDYMKRANVVVIAEQWPNMSPITMVEALSGGKAVVAGKIGGIPEFIENGKTGFLVEYNNPDEYADKIIKLVNDPDLVKSIGKTASKSVVNIFDREKIGKQYVNLYEELIV